MEFLLEPLGYNFVRQALLAAVLAGGVAALVGTFVMLRGMAFLGGALSHAVLPGIAIAHITGHSIVLGAFVAALVTSVGVGFITRHQQLKEDTAIGILFTAMFALGIAIISTIRSYTTDLTNYLFGNVLAVSTSDIWLIVGVAAVVLVALALFGRQWLILSFDPVFAAAAGLRVRALHYGLLIMLSLAIVTAMQAVGVVLVLAMLVTPPATARLLVKKVHLVMVLGVFFSSVAAIAGLYASYYFNIASGAAIVLASAAMFFIVFVTGPLRINLKRRWKRAHIGGKKRGENVA